MKSEFYELLSKDETFCQALGRLMLVASKLEVLIKQYLRLQCKEVGERQATLGNLIKLLKKNNHLTKNGEMHFQQANMQRNYLIHNLFASFENEIERNLLPVENLIEMDVFVYTQQVNVSIENFASYCEIVSEGIDKHNKKSQKDAAEAAPLL
jgi:predicted transcriptional regulator